MGAWYSVWAEKNLIFSATTQYLWRKLLDRAEPAPIAKVADVHVPMSQLGLGAKSKACALSICNGQQRLIESSRIMGDLQC